MILISIRGLDQFVVAHYSKEHTSKLASIFKCKEDDIDFYAPYGSIFHKGVEQTSWDTFVFVEADISYQPLEEEVAKYLVETLSEVSINVHVLFRYFAKELFYSAVNENYPRHIDDSHIAKELEDEDNYDYEGEGDPASRPDLDYNDPSQIYLGNTFENLDEKIELEKARRQKEHEDSCDDDECHHHHH